MNSEASRSPEPTRKDNPFKDLVFNLLIPILILKKGDDWLGIDPVWVLMLALAFPIGFGLKDFISKRKVNLFSVLGFINVILTGVIGLLELSPGWIAVKEAAVPAVFCIAIIISMRTRYPLVRTLLYNPRILKTELIHQRLELRGAVEAFEHTLRMASWYLAASFFVSSILNFILARIMVKTHPSVDMVQFNNEISSMWMWSMIVIVVPSMSVMMFALWTIFRGIKNHTGLTLEEVMVGMEVEAEPPPPQA